ncbi:hypothetical protein ARMGADRAFT_1067667 [Armillaria gallica]|uniref:Uncharacterized protein n=1 Tax=Armillaria gallica TaxID=47427 RepID=A0A2H3CLR7_ARMGA|nr:hypothetical protein ARMGADRAFT_1067667 [Armillaria gallica]
MPPDETTYIWDIDGTKKSWAKGEYCVHWIIVYGKPTMYIFECVQDPRTWENYRLLDALYSEMIIWGLLLTATITYTAHMGKVLHVLFIRVQWSILRAEIDGDNISTIWRTLNVKQRAARGAQLWWVQIISITFDSIGREMEGFFVIGRLTSNHHLAAACKMRSVPKREGLATRLRAHRLCAVDESDGPNEDNCEEGSRSVAANSNLTFL